MPRHGIKRAALLLLASAALVVAQDENTPTPTPTPAPRNHADNYTRGGAWIYHEDAGPCGYDPLRLNCSFSDPRNDPREALTTAAVKLSVSSQLINHLDPLLVTFDVGSYKPTSKDWIGVYCAENEAAPPSDRQYLDWQYASKATNNAIQFGPLTNMRCAWQFRYFTYNGADAYVNLGSSPFVRHRQGPTEPLHVRAAATGTPGEMRIMWVSAAVNQPYVEYSERPSAITHRAKASVRSSYAASDMCQSPATTVASNLYRDPGVIYSAILTDLKPNTKYYYYIDSGDGKARSKRFTLKTPPVPGKQNGVASFFVYGDLGDWNIHATGPLPVKRSATTIELMRRDMNDPRANYVAILHDGDLSYAMGATYLWDQFGALIEPVASEVAYMVGVGNHEYCYTSGGEKDPSGAGATNGFHPPEGNYGVDSRGECAVPTNKRFIMPANGNQVFWWSVEMGLVHHTMISSEHDYTTGSPMFQWLEKDLASVDRKKTPWLFLHLHRPMYTSEDYASDYKVSLFIRKYLEPLLAKYRVDAVFSGHYHAYELTCPVYQEVCRSETLPNGLKKAKAPVHIMVGSAGADVDNTGYYDVPWRVEAQLEYGYGRVHVHNATHAQWEFVRNRDEIVAGSTWIISDHDWSV
ncbi:hypothetical protein PINS_up018604 [Pythium insidiosum]|nr:hypothetical protein PINS_up018604 [Pythium insidiosum]